MVAGDARARRRGDRRARWRRHRPRRRGGERGRRRCCPCRPAPTTPSRRCGRRPSRAPPPRCSPRTASRPTTSPTAARRCTSRRATRTRSRWSTSASRPSRTSPRRRCGSPRPCASSTAPSPSRTRSACPASPGCCTRSRARTRTASRSVWERRCGTCSPRSRPGSSRRSRSPRPAPLRVGDARRVALSRGTVAVDGEREIAFGPATPVTVTLAHDGPRVLDVRAALAAAAAQRLLVRENTLQVADERGTQMKAARFHGPGDIRIDDVPEPQVGPGQVKVDVEWCGICGTDLHEYLEGPIFIPPKGSPHPLTGEEMPVVMGHEFAGVVSEIGDGVTNVEGGRPGRRRALRRLRRVLGLHDRPLQHLPQARLRRARRAAGRLRREVRRRGPVGAPARRHPDRPRRAGRAARRRLPRGAAVRAEAGRHRGGVRRRARSGSSTTAALKAAGASKVFVVEPAAVRKAKAPGAGADEVLDPTEVDVPDGGPRPHRRRGRRRRVRVRGHRRRARLGDRVGAPRRHRRQRRDLGPRGPRGGQRAGVLRDQPDRHARLLRATTRRPSACCATGRSTPASSSPAGSGSTTWSSKGFRELIDNKEENVKILVSPKDLA